MAVVTPASQPRAAPRSPAPWAWVAVVLAPLIGVGMAAVASIVVAVLAVPVAFLLTRDGYVALLALSYGPYAAAQVLACVAVAATVWGGAWLIGRGGVRRRWVAAISGMLGSVLGLWLAPLPLLAASLRYGPALPFTAGLGIVVALAGGLAGSVPALRPRSSVGALTWRAALVRAGGDVAAFALALALLLEGWVALTALFG